MDHLSEVSNTMFKVSVCKYSLVTKIIRIDDPFFNNF